MRRVLAICHQFPPVHQTGTEILCLSTMQALQRRGHSVSVVTADPDRLHGRPPSVGIVDGIDVIRVPTRRLWPRDTLGRTRLELANGAAQSALVAAVAAAQPDVVHVHHSFGFGFPTLAALARARPVVLTVTDYAPVCPYATLTLPNGDTCPGPTADRSNCVAHMTMTSGSSGPGGIILRLLAGAGGIEADQLIEQRLRSAVELFRDARVVAVTSLPMHDVFRDAGLPTERMIVLPHRAPPVSVPRSEVGSPLRIGFLGTLKAHKGAHVFLEAVQRLPANLPCIISVRGDLSADPAYVQMLRRIAGTDSRISILDRVPHPRFGEAVGALDVVVVPSLWPENLPLVLLTALNHGRFVVVSDAPGLVPALQPGDGAMVPVGDPAALAATLAALIRDPAPVRLVRARAAPERSFEAYIDAVEAMYDRALSQQGTRVE